MKIHHFLSFCLCTSLLVLNTLPIYAEESNIETLCETQNDTTEETIYETLPESSIIETLADSQDELFSKSPVENDSSDSPSSNEHVYAFVERMYRIVLNRTSDLEGMNYWYDSLMSGERVGADIVHGFFFSEEFLNFNYTDEETIHILYRALFDREADADGFSDWMDACNAGVSLRYLCAGFIGSQEYHNMCHRFGIIPGSIDIIENRDKNLSITQFVTHFYHNCQGRSGDADGLNDWTGGLIDGRYNAVTIVEGFLYSPEFQNKNLCPEDFIEVLYQTMLCRSSDPAGKADWTSRLENGTPKEQIIAGFVNSTEFHELCDTYGISHGHMPLDMPKIQNTYTIPDLKDGTLSTFNCENTLSPETQAEINRLVQNISSKNVGFVLIDLMSGRGISYNAEKLFFSASTIKGPYVACINEKIPDSRTRHANAMEKTIKDSNNQTYGTLKNTYGTPVFSEWLTEAGCSWVNTRTKYTNITSKALAQMWVRMYTYLRSNQPNAEWCKNLFTHTKESFISEALSPAYTVYSKAGWTYYDIRNDGGIVLKNGHPYVLTILSNKYHKKTELKELANVLDRAHSELILQ